MIVVNVPGGIHLHLYDYISTMVIYGCEVRNVLVVNYKINGVHGILVLPCFKAQ